MTGLHLSDLVLLVVKEEEEDEGKDGEGAGGELVKLLDVTVVSVGEVG